MPVPFFKVGDLIRRLAPSLGLETKLVEHLVRQRWEEIVGSQVARHTEPCTIRFRKLTVHARSSIWVQQLTFLKPTLLDKINEAAGAAVITDLVLRVGELAERQADQPTPRTTDQAGSEAGPSDDLLEEAARHVLAVRDEELRLQLARLIAAAAQAPVRSAPRSAGASPPRPRRGPSAP